MKKFFADFKKFISRGNILDMAVGVIIGAAFGKIVTSLVNDILMPLITWACGANSLAELSIPLRTDAEGVVTLAWNYGNFIQTIIDFLIIAFSIFLVLRIVMKSQEKFKQLDKTLKKNTLNKREKQILRERGIDFKDKKALKAAMLALHEEERLKAEEEKALAEANKPESQDKILKDIRDLLVKMNEKQETETIEKKD